MCEMGNGVRKQGWESRSPVSRGNMSSPEVVKQGFLVKKGHIRHNWRTRWFVLKNDSLSYFKKREDTTPAGVIPLVGASLECLPVEACKKPWILQLTTHECREFLIQAPDQSTRDDWKTAIEDRIRRLDPTKLGTVESLARSLSGTSNTSSVNRSERDMVQAMQDAHAGVRLYPFRAKGASRDSHYFTGKEAISWLISWSFALTRSEAVSIATSLLKHGFFHSMHLEEGVRSDSVITTDALLGKVVIDSEDMKYVFAVFAPGECMTLFHSDEESDDSNSEDDLLMTRSSITSFTIGIELDGRILRQGFLMKKGHRRHNWKARKFVLREKSQYLYYYRGSKSQKPQGGIPLQDLTVLELDDEETDQLEPQRPRQRGSPPTTATAAAAIQRRRTQIASKNNRFLLITASGTRYVLGAASAEERLSWVSELKVASASQLVLSR